MKTVSCIRGWKSVAVVSCLMAGLAQAQSGIGNPNDVADGGAGNHYGWGNGAPTAPEPMTLAMSALGVCAVGGYVVYRRRRNNRTSTPS